MLKITLAQINPTIGDINGNLGLMKEAAELAYAKKSDLVIFPELSLTGYYPADMLDEHDFTVNVLRGLSYLRDMSKAYPELHFVVGSPTVCGGPGKRYHNSLIVIKNGVDKLKYDKQCLPTYNVFDERRHFEPGADVARVLRIKDAHIGFLVCEDGWNDAGEDYAVNPYQRLRDAQCDLVVSINASPSNIGKREQRHEIFGAACERHQLPLLYVNQVGGHDQLVYDGASFAMEPLSHDYHLAFEARRFQEDIVHVQFDTNKGKFLSEFGTRPSKPDEVGLSTMEFYRQQIVLGLKDYARRCGFQKAVVGCSGGIDSALTLALAVEALGADNVIGITMPSEYSSAGSVSDSEALCAALGIELLTHPIRPLVDQYKASFEGATGTALAGLALENVQARIRGTALMEYSNTFGHLLLTTGNKSEIAVGYCTLYGDTNGGLGLIGDLYKTEIFALCEHINHTAGREIIPYAIINKPPSAELAPGQKDTDSLPDYPILDAFLKLFIEGARLAVDEHAEATEIVRGLQESNQESGLAARIKRMIARSEYKRRQAAPILRVRSRAFGSGRQLPIAAVVYQDVKFQ